MKVENQLCTLPQAKKLKKLGVAQRSLFWFAGDEKLRLKVSNYSGAILGSKPHAIPFQSDEPGCNPQCFSAFTVAELGAMCRDCISGHCANTKSPGKYYATPDEYAGYDIDALIGEVLPFPDPLPCYCQADTQAQALADLLIWLLETKGITPEEVNKRLEAA